MLCKNKSKYKDTYSRIAYQIRLRGGTIKDVASQLNVHLSTVYNWRHEYASFDDALTLGGLRANTETAKRIIW